ncbi:hypothetical protein I4U23_000621 [Adineta vaga]|nr:hypothetical protein I4U23_000621 [Adineta vaga]
MTSSYTATKQWTVRVTGLSMYVTTGELSIQFDIDSRLIDIYMCQSNSSEQYALINGFKSEEEADDFVFAWNETFTRGQTRIRCQLNGNEENMMNDQSKVSRQSDDYSSYSNRSRTDYNSTDDDDVPAKFTSPTARDDSYSSHGKSRSKQIQCRHGDNCFTADCSYMHSSHWRVCKYGVQCNNFDCTATHPKPRKSKCKHGSKCRTSNCSYLHPNANDKDTNIRKHRSHSSVHVSDNDSDEKSQNNTNKVQTHQRHQHLKSFEMRMNERKMTLRPIFTLRTEFCERLQEEKIVFVTAETGSGKSTQLPQYAAEYFRNDLVVSIQPRPVTCMLLAHRVADEFDGTVIGNSVGYQVGNDQARKSACVIGTNIMFMTDTAFMYEYQMDPDLSRVRVLIIDEVYERSLNTDIIIGIAKLLLTKRPTDFFVVIVSTTMNPKPFLKFFDLSSALTLNTINHIHSVTVENLPPPTDCPDYKVIEVHVIPTLLRFYHKHTKHTLVFISNQRDIEKAIEVFSTKMPNDCVVFPLYGSLPFEQQKEILDFDDKQSKKRMVIFCTNIAETSLPIRNVQLVIDTGFVRELRFDMQHRWNVLETVRISRFSANKRRDLVNYTKRGRCVRLYDDTDLKEENIEPEILRSSLDLSLLQFKRLRINIQEFPFLTKPMPDSIRHSMDLLTDLVCIDDKKDITWRGELFAELSIDPRLSAFMTNIYAEQKDGQRLLSLVTTIAAILSAPGSLFLSKDTIDNRITFDTEKSNSDLFRLCTIFNEWKSAGKIDRKSNKCQTCRKIPENNFDFCQSCQIKHSFMNGLNNQVLEFIENSIEFYRKTITNPRSKLRTGNRIFTKQWTDEDIIGKHLGKVFPTQVGHLLVPHLPNEGVHFIHNDILPYFVTMSITRLLSGKYVVDRLHQIPSRNLPASPIEQILVRENVGASTDNQIRTVLNNVRSEPWAKWLVHDYDRLSSRLSIWGLKRDRAHVESILEPILSKTNVKIIECGLIRATFQNGLICSAIEIMEDALRINLQQVPCETFEELQIWLKTKLNISRHDIRENNFQERRKKLGDDDDDDDDDDYEAPPFYIVLKSMEAFQRATAKLPAHHICSQEALSLSTTGTHMNEKDSWGRQLVLTIPAENSFLSDKEILDRLVPYAVDCRRFGRRSVRIQPGIQLINLPRETNEAFVRKILRPINPLKISLRQTHKDNLGSSSAHIFFVDHQQCEQSKTNLQSDFCQIPVIITVRNRTSHQLVKKHVLPTVNDLENKDSTAQTFLITAMNRESALKLYKEIIPKLDSTWKIDSTATVTVTHPHLYPDFETLIQQIAKQFEIQVHQQSIHQKQQKFRGAIRCFFHGGVPQKTALAASMLAQATSSIIIKITNDRQKQLFDELFLQKIIQDWANKLKLEVRKIEKSNVWIEIRGPQVQQGELMRQIGDYSDIFDNDSVYLTDIQLQTLDETWINWGCHITYKSRTKSIILYAEPTTNLSLIESCETEVKQFLTKLSVDGNIIRDKQKCVFCSKISYSTNTFRACDHAYCRCATAQLSSIYPLQCNGSKCKTNIAIEDLLDIFPEREAFIGLCKKSIQIYLNNNSSMFDQVFCPNSECNGLIKRTRGYQTCFTCGRDVCPSCSLIDNDSHRGRTCKEREMFEKMGDYLPSLFQAAEKFARDNWLPSVPPIIRVDYNMALADQCASLKRFYKGVESLSIAVPPDMARGFFAFHGTAATAIKPICTDGFDPKRRAGQACGPGEYFGVSAAISHGYCRPTNPTGPYAMIIGFLLNCPQLSTRPGFCHVMNNPIDWSSAFNVPVVVVSYGTQTSCSSPLST